MSKVSVLKIFHGILGPATLILPLISLLYCTISCENNLDLCFLRLIFFPFLVLWIKLLKNEVANNVLSHRHCVPYLK